MEDYKANSHKAKNEQADKKVEKIVTGGVKTKKKSGVDKVKGVFISEDASNIKSYVLMDILVPAVKKAVSDIVTNGIDMLLYGETGRSTKRSSSSYVSYNRFSDRKSEDRISARTRTGYDFDDIILEDRGEAEEVLTRMDELLETYGMVTVADMYDLIGVSCNYTDNNYGWTSLRSADIVRARGGGYMLKLPKALPIK